ncbi:SDR family NAD(P)-dependent oxidoreductase [Novipirellula artificiosorum]|uniref:3-oxoacyl-[acyl-carrier-protein] reductase FabG1 n=1 Tax=Novipirellula artificiosorum TaxID=2528016 RepID=A0A5C6DJX3_9BACT|nr:SDR family oxidoreductase [Novipirellula artificiosorum]TWU37038.1 3-oxoacyl-[acyl-carrier-protein] reductase FabG1 [Novipirellula artificiosorum]
MYQKHYLIVGGSHGIGFGIVQRLLSQGAAVTIVSRTRGRLDELDADTTSSIHHVAADVTGDQIDTFPLPDRLDGLAYCPGSINLSPLRMTKPELLRSDFEVNVVGAVRVMQRAAASLKAADLSSIVLFSTVAVGTGLAMHTSVAAAKGALEGVARSWAAELAPKTRVNCIAPALTDTPLSERLLSSEAKRSSMAKLYPLGRVGTIDDIASMAVFLLGEASSWITGQVIAVDGGLSRVKSM